MGKTRNTICLVFSMLAPAVLSAQGLVVIPSSNLKERRDAMEHTYAAWVKVDANLERDVFRQPPAKARERINAAEEQVDTYFTSREAYLAAFISRVREVIATLDTPPAKLEAHDLKESVDRKLKDLDSAEDDLRRQAAVGTGEKDPRRILVGYEARKEMQKVQELRQNLQNQSELLEGAGNTNTRLENARSEMLASHQSLLRMLTADEERTKMERSIWHQYYETLRDLVPQQPSPEQPNEKKPGDQAR
jgi:hypothetical protein